MRAAGLACIAAALLASRPARAEPEYVRYGKRIAIVDGVAAGVIGVGVYAIVDGQTRELLSGEQLAGLGLTAVGGAIYLVGGPIVHGRRDNRSSAWTSLAARAVLPAAGGLIGYLIDEERQVCDGVGYCGPDVFAPTLTIVGAAGAMALDWFVLAEVEAAPYAAPAPGGGTTIGLAGRF